MPGTSFSTNCGRWRCAPWSMPASALTSANWKRGGFSMAREISSRFRLAGTLVAKTPSHVGGYGDDVDTDLPLARDGRGDLYVPGTSLAGALRQWCDRAFGAEFVRRHWGFQKDDDGHASSIIVEDVRVDDAR